MSEQTKREDPRYNIVPSLEDLPKTLPAVFLHSGHKYMADALRSIRDELARHHIACGRSFIVDAPPDYDSLDRVKRVAALREAERYCVCALEWIRVFNRAMSAHEQQHLDSDPLDAFILFLQDFNGGLKNGNYHIDAPPDFNNSTADDSTTAEVSKDTGASEGSKPAQE